MKITTMRGLDGARAALNKRSCPEPRSTAVGHGELSSPDSCPIVRHMSAYGPVRRAPCTTAHRNRGGGRGQPGPRWSLIAIQSSGRRCRITCRGPTARRGSPDQILVFLLAGQTDGLVRASMARRRCRCPASLTCCPAGSTPSRRLEVGSSLEPASLITAHSFGQRALLMLRLSRRRIGDRLEVP